MKKLPKRYNVDNRMWRGIAIVAGVFSFVVCVLLIANYVQLNRMDPVNTETINMLVERLSKDPSDNQLREEIRALDLLVRKAYFTNRWQIRTGGYLLLIGVAVIIIALQVIALNKKITPVVLEQHGDDFFFSQKAARKWIAISGTLLVLTALVLAFLTHQKLLDKFDQAAIAVIDQNGMDESPDQKKIIPGTGSVVTTDISSDQEVVEPAQDKVDRQDISEEGSQDEVNPYAGTMVKRTDVKSSDLKGFPTEKEIRENFTTFRGPGGNGISYHTGIPENWNGETGENVLWKIALPLRGFNSPVIWDDKLFVTGADESKREVYCIDRHTGEIIWTALVDNIMGSPAQSPEVANYTGYAAPTVATDGRKVYAIFSNGDIIALDMDGNRVWSRNLGVPQNHYGYSSSLMMYENKVIVQYDNKTLPQLIALDAGSGETVWSTTRDVKISWASPVVVSTGDRTEIILAADPGVASYDPISGKELWRLDCIYGEVGPSVAYADGIVFALNEYANLVAIKLGEQPGVLWEDSEYLSDVPSPVATDEFLFVATSYGVVVCYDAKTGEKYWEKEFDNTIYASPIISEGKVYLIDKKGVMHIFKVDKEFVPIAEPTLGEKAVCSPAFANGRIYLRGYKNLFCIGKK